MPFHLRYTPYELNTENLTTFCDKYDKYIIAKEYNAKSGEKCETHYHIYIESDLNIDTIRGDFLKKLAIPKAGGMGRNNKYYMLKKWDQNIEYIIKQGLIEACKGFDLAELRARVPPLVQKEKIEKNTGSTAAPPAKKKESNFWNEIMERSILWEKKHEKKIEVEDALKIITICYFSKGLPLPHPGDRKRWAISLVMYSKMKWEYDPQHDQIIEEEAARFMGEHMVTNKLA